MISSYERSLFEQQTPYLQWMKERKRAQSADYEAIKGKQVKKLPFFSCEQSLEEVVKESAEKLRETDFVLFYSGKGYLEPEAECYFAEYFMKHESVVIAYADEDYLGGLQEFYGDKVQESELAAAYRFRDTSYYRGEPWFKPDYSPDTLRSFFYFGNVFAIQGAVLGEELEENGQQSIYKMVLSLVEKTGYAGHIAEILFTNEVKMKEEAFEKHQNQEKCIINEKYASNAPTNIEYTMLCKQNDDNSLISIIIPSKDNSNILKRCLSTLVEFTDYPYYEMIIVDNGSTKQELMCIREVLTQTQEDYALKWADAEEPKGSLSIQHIYQKAEFNFSKMCNLGARAANGQLLLFLNDDMEMIDSSWLRRMKTQAQMPHVGAVGAKLYYPKAMEKEPYRIQHAGITNMGIGPAHKLAGMKDEGNLYHGHNLETYNMLAVTAACLMVRKECFWETGGFDEALAVAYNDVDLCFKLYEKGYYNVLRNDVVLLHHESLSRGQDTSPERKARLEREKELLYKKHPLLKAKDPFYSEHLVQWKKDVTYSCNYLYPYDKICMPRLLNAAEIGKLPKEHRNKYIRKLTGENLSMLEIDSVEVSEADGTVLIQGWYVMRKHDNAVLERALLLRNIESGEIYELGIEPKLRYDVEALFQEEAGKTGHGTINTALSGLHCMIDRNVLVSGSYQIGIRVTTKKQSRMVGKICWKKDCIVNV